MTAPMTRITHRGVRYQHGPGRACVLYGQPPRAGAAYRQAPAADSRWRHRNRRGLVRRGVSAARRSVRPSYRKSHPEEHPDARPRDDRRAYRASPVRRRCAPRRRCRCRVVTRLSSGKHTMIFKTGELVSWSSQAGSGMTAKTVTVVAVIASGADGARQVRAQIDRRVKARIHRSAFVGGSAGTTRATWSRSWWVVRLPRTACTGRRQQASVGRRWVRPTTRSCGDCARSWLWPSAGPLVKRRRPGASDEGANPPRPVQLGRDRRGRQRGAAVPVRGERATGRAAAAPGDRDGDQCDRACGSSDAGARASTSPTRAPARSKPRSPSSLPSRARRWSGSWPHPQGVRAGALSRPTRRP